MTLAELPKPPRENQTTIRLAIDLARVQQLQAGQEMAFLSDVDTEVYVVRRFGDETQVTPVVIRGDAFTMKVENR